MDHALRQYYKAFVTQLYLLIELLNLALMHEFNPCTPPAFMQQLIMIVFRRIIGLHRCDFGSRGKNDIRRDSTKATAKSGIVITLVTLALLVVYS
jgi:hypothetical protein